MGGSSKSPSRPPSSARMLMSLHARGASRPEVPPVGGRRTVFGQRLTQMGHHRHSSTNHRHHHSHCRQWWLIILLLLEVTRHFGKCASDLMILNKIDKTNMLMLQVENRTDVTPQRLPCHQSSSQWCQMEPIYDLFGYCLEIWIVQYIGCQRHPENLEPNHHQQPLIKNPGILSEIFETDQITTKNQHRRCMVGGHHWWVNVELSYILRILK